MEQEYQVGLISIEGGYTAYGPFTVKADNVFNAIEAAFMQYGIPYIHNTMIAVQLPDSPIVLKFEYAMAWN